MEQSLANDMGVRVEVVLNPQRDLTELPLKSFYRYVLQDQLVFDASGRYTITTNITTNNPSLARIHLS
jgi:hypothetical protein